MQLLQYNIKGCAVGLCQIHTLSDNDVAAGTAVIGVLEECGSATVTVVTKLLVTSGTVHSKHTNLQ